VVITWPLGAASTLFIRMGDLHRHASIGKGACSPYPVYGSMHSQIHFYSGLSWVKDAPASAEAPWSWLPPAAYDVSLKMTFQDPRSPMYWDKMGASFVWPPLGGTVSHVSGTKGATPGESSVNSPDRWDAPWMSYGTRSYPARQGDKRSKQRYVAGYSMKGPCPFYKHYIKLPAMLEELQWRNAPPLPPGEPAAPSQPGNRGSLQPPSGKGKPKPGNSRIDKIRQFKTLRGIEPANPASGSTEPRGKGQGARNDDSNLRKLTKLRERWEKLRRATSQPIPDDAVTKPAGVCYDSPPRTLEHLARPQVGTEEELERLFHMRFYYQPQDDMCRFAFKLSIDQGKNNYPTKEAASQAAQKLLEEFFIEIKQEEQYWDALGQEPKCMLAHEVFA